MILFLKVFKERYTNIEVVRGGPVAIDCISMQVSLMYQKTII